MNPEDGVLQKMQEQIDTNKALAEATARKEKAGTVWGVDKYTVATLPIPSAARVGWLALATDGRKAGEGAGDGTGVLVYCADDGTGDYVWLRSSSDTEVED
jgi:hypothetical protein